MKSCLVTGCASGIGRAVAQRLAAHGHALILFDNNAEALEGLEAELAAPDRTARLAGSVADPDACAAAVALAEQRFGGLDGVSHNAGIQRYGTVETTEPDLWDEVIAVNLTGGYLVCRAAMALLRARRGAVVLMGSVQSLASQQGVVAYTAAKHGLLGLGRAMAMDHAADGVRVNVVAPGAVDTPMLDWAVSLTPDPAALRHTLDRMHPMGRIARPAEVADLVAYLLSDRASFITGEVIRVDGGLLSQIGGSPEARA